MIGCNAFLRTWIALFTLSALTGCAIVGPNYSAPVLSKIDVPAQWTSQAETVHASADTNSTLASPSRWWAELSDPALDELVTSAFASSPTLEAGLAKLRQSRSLYAQALAASVPSVDGRAAIERAASETSTAPATASWGSVNSSWEIDLFGAVQRGQEGAFARDEAQVATLADVRVSLAADVTDAYLSYRACQSNLALSQEDVTSRIATQKLTATSVEVGFVAPYQGIRSTASVAEARTRFAETKAQCERLENLLTRLTGIARPTLMKILAEQPIGLVRLPVPRHFSIAIPGQALTHRPDMRAAERLLAAASADIGLAEADRYPRLTLNGSLGYSATGKNGLGSPSFGIWSFGPALSLPIFDGGRRKAEVEKAKAKYDEAFANYKLKARSAIQEIEDALTRYAAANERAENARVAASEYQRFFDAVEERYREGANNLLELEDARRVMLSAQQTLLGVQQERLQAWIALNRATGGAAQYESETNNSLSDNGKDTPSTPPETPHAAFNE